MIVTTQDGKQFRLESETHGDQLLLDRLDGARTAYVTHTERTPHQEARSGFENHAVILMVDHSSKQALISQAGRQALSALGQLFSLGLSEAANHGHIGTAATHPQAQEQLAASLVQLQVMLQALRDVVSKQEIMLKEVNSAHGEPLVVETAILSQKGGAA